MLLGDAVFVFYFCFFGPLYLQRERDVPLSGGAGGGEGVLFLRAPSGEQTNKISAKTSFFPIFDFILGVN